MIPTSQTFFLNFWILLLKYHYLSVLQLIEYSNNFGRVLYQFAAFLSSSGTRQRIWLVIYHADFRYLLYATMLAGLGRIISWYFYKFVFIWCIINTVMRLYTLQNGMVTTTNGFNRVTSPSTFSNIFLLDLSILFFFDQLSLPLLLSQ